MNPHFSDEWRMKSEEDVARTLVARKRQSELLLAGHGQSPEHKTPEQITAMLHKLVAQFEFAPSDRLRRRVLESVGALSLTALVEMTEREEVDVTSGDAAA